jgi:hypothetical protein
MSDQKLTDLSAAGTLDGTELLYMVQAGNDVKVTAQAVADLAAGGGAVDSVNGQTGVVSLDTDDIPEGTAKYNVQADWSATTGLAAILNKPTLATVATSGAYSDLSGSPSLATVATTGAYSDLSGAPSLATVATTGSYNDLSDKPSIPSGTVTSVAMTVPTGLSVSGSPITGSGTFGVTLASGYVIPLQTTLDGKAAASHTHAISDVTGLQTALDGKQPLATVLTNTTAAFTTAQETKLAGIATAATANSSDAALRDRTTHTGEQAISTVTGLQTALDAKQATLVSATNIKTINGASVLGSGDLTVTGTGSEPVHFIRQGSNYTLTSTTDGQKIFNTTANGELTLPTGIYQFECGLYLLSMSGSSGNASFQLNGSGTATVTSVFYSAVGLDNSSPLNSSARGGSISVSSSSVTNGLGTAGTGTGLASYVTGIFEVTVTGTIIPRIALTTAAAAVLQANSFFKCQKIAATGVTATSEWS